jgi:hypothetical protein
VAFHLHRLKLAGRRLREVGINPNSAADLAAARTPLTTIAAYALARILDVSTTELTRALEPDEVRVWAFYRAAAANPRHVWDSARRAWRAACCSDVQAAQIMGVDPSVIWRAATAPNRHILSFERAKRLTTALSIAQGPEVFLPLPKDEDQQPSR